MHQAGLSAHSESRKYEPQRKNITEVINQQTRAMNDSNVGTQ